MKDKQFPTISYVTISFLILILVVLTGCGPLEAGAFQPDAVQPGAAASVTPVATAAGIDLGEIGTVEVGIEPTPLPENASYTNQEYGFTFDFPETWELTEGDHGVVLHKGNNRLGINFRRSDESDVNPYFGRTGIGAGDFIYAGKVSFMGQVIPVQVLLMDKKSKAVFYNGTSLIESDGLVFMIALEDLETDYLDVDISEETMSEANAIVESFKRIAAADADTALEPSGFLAFLSAPKSTETGSGEPIKINFVLKNISSEPLYLLKWYTPLEGIAGDIFEITRDGEPVPYEGILASRGNPSPESYIKLDPGKGESVEVPIATAYDFSKPGTYTIRYRSPRISHIAHSEAEMATTLDELGPVNIPSNDISMLMAGSPASLVPPLRRTAEEAGEMISRHLLKMNPGLMEAPPLTFEEISDENVWEELQAQVFVVTEGIFKPETFLLRYDQVVQLGEAIGGQGLLSMVVSDLDQDVQPELLFTYSAGLSPNFGSGTQTRVGMVDVTDKGEHVIEANMAYLGTAALKAEGTTVVSLNVAEIDENTRELHYKEILGYLFIEKCR